MKRITLILLLIISSSVLKAQSPSDERQTINVLKTFYTAYMTKMASSDPDSEKTLTSLKKRYCTENLLKKIKNVDYDADPIIDAQDSNMESVKNLSFKKDIQRSGWYIVSYYYVDPYSKKKEGSTINVKVVDQKGLLKIGAISIKHPGFSTITL